MLMETTFTDDMNLNEMRDQIKLLRAKLDKETIVNEALVRKVLRGKVQKLERQRRMSLVMGLLWLPFTIAMCRMLIGMSWALCAVTLAYGLFAAGFTLWTHRGVNSQAAINGNLLTMVESVTRMRRLGCRWLWFSVPFLALWLTWFFYELTMMVESDAVRGTIAGGIVGAIVGLAIGLYKYREFRRTTQEILTQIEEMRQ